MSLVFASFSFNAFVHNDLSARETSNTIMNIFANIYTKLILWIGFTGTGIVFAICAIGIIVAAILDKKPQQSAVTQQEH